MTRPTTYRGRSIRARHHFRDNKRPQAASILLRSVRDLQKEPDNYGTERTWAALEDLFPEILDGAESLEDLDRALAEIAEGARIGPEAPGTDRRTWAHTTPSNEAPDTRRAWETVHRAVKASGCSHTAAALRLARRLYLANEDRRSGGY